MEERVFRLSSRSVRDASLVGLLFAVVLGGISTLLLLRQMMYTPQDVTWGYAIAIGISLIVIRTSLRAIRARVIVSPAGYSRSNTPGVRGNITPWQQVDSVFIKEPKAGKEIQKKNGQMPRWAIIRNRQGKNLFIPGDIDGFNDLVGLLEKYAQGKIQTHTGSDAPDSEGNGAVTD